jgi:3-hydroxyisobutyrate dehydrogenase
MKVGFIGVGAIGEHMCRNILKAGHKVVVHDINPEPVKRLSSEGATSKKSPKDLAAVSEVIILMVVNDEQVRKVIIGKNGVLSGLQPNTTVIIMCTVSPEVCIEMAHHVEKSGASFIEAPVVKSLQHAIVGELGIYVGGSLDAYARVKTVLECMGKNIIRMGEVGKGMAMKLCHNMLTAEIVQAVSEMLVLAQKAGLDFDDIVTAISYGGAQTFFFDTKAEIIKKRDFSPKFAIEYMDKDVSLSLKLADSVKVSLPGAGTAKQVLKAAVAMGFHKEDFSAVIKVIEKLSGM